MALRLSSKALLRACSNATRTLPYFKNVSVLNYHKALKANTPALHYAQSRGIFWGDKKKEDGTTDRTTQEHEKEEQKTTSQEKTAENKTSERTEQTQAKSEKTTAKEPETKQEETTQKTQHTSDAKKTHKKEEAPESLDKLIEGLNPEAKKRIQALFHKLEKDVQDGNKQLEKTKSSASVADKAIADWKQKVEDLRTRLKEEVDERELMRKRFDKELEQSKVFAITKFAKDLLDVPDNLGRALDASKNLEGKGDNLFDGVKATNTILLKVFERHGIKQVSPMGEKFDPNYHEALFDFDDPSKRPGTVGYVAGNGYVLNDRCLRPAKVGVVKGKYIPDEEPAKESAKAEEK